MESRLDSIFTAHIRQTEALDTRQAIRRHEDLPERRHPDERDSQEDEEGTEDLPRVSVSALRAFLEELVRGALDDRTPATVQSHGQEYDEKNRHQADAQTREQSARATQAYQRTYRATHAPDPSSTPQSIPHVELTTSEIKTIKVLLDDLVTLSAQGKETLVLNKSTSFLQSLVEAVELALSPRPG